MENIINVLLYSMNLWEFAAFVIAVLYLNKRTKWQALIIPMGATVVIEFFGWLLKEKLHTSNTWLYNFLLLIQVPFYLMLLLKFTNNIIIRKVISLSLYVYFIMAFINYFFIQGIISFNSYTQVLSSIILIVIPCIILYQILKDFKIDNPYKNEWFWLCTGLLLFNLGSIITVIFRDSLTLYYKNTGIRIYSFIFSIVSIILYSCLIKSFICRHRATKQLLP